jgi:hypothetical protein
MCTTSLAGSGSAGGALVDVEGRDGYSGIVAQPAARSVNVARSVRVMGRNKPQASPQRDSAQATVT